MDAGAATMVGGDIESDSSAALHAILVRTGKYQEDRTRESGIQPTRVVDAIADMPPLLST